MSLYRRQGSPNWWIRLSVGGFKARVSTGTSDRREAEEFEQLERERLWRLHKLGDKAAVLWQDVSTRWLAETTKRSKNQDKIILRWLADYLDDEPISAVDPETIQKLRIYAGEDGMSRSTTDRYMALLRAILRKCELEWGLLPRAPRVPMYGQSAQKRHMRFLTRAECARLIRALPTKHLKLAARLAVWTGLRMRSMLQLTWDRIDLDSRRLWIPGSQMKNGKALGIPLNRQAVIVLGQLKRMNPSGSYVFQWNGRPVDDCNGKAFKAAVKRAELDPLRWHDLRHTFASWALQGGVTLHELMQLGGWQSYVMVLRYAHLAPEHLSAAANKIGNGGKRVLKQTGGTKRAHPKSDGTAGIGQVFDNSGVNGADSQNRTVDPIITNDVLYQLS
jgi:integrase